MQFSKAVFLISGILVGATSLGVTGSLAQDQDRTRDQLQDRDQVPDQDRTRDQLQDRDQVPDQDRTRDQDQTRDRLNDQTSTLSTSATAAGGAQVQYGPNNVYGWQLMTAQERATYQNQMRNAKTEQERQRIAQQHRTEMQARARQRNMLLPGMSAPQSRMGTGMGGMGSTGGTTGGMGGMGGSSGGGRGGR